MRSYNILGFQRRKGLGKEEVHMEGKNILHVAMATLFGGNQ